MAFFFFVRKVCALFASVPHYVRKCFNPDSAYLNTCQCNILLLEMQRLDQQNMALKSIEIGEVVLRSEYT